MCTRPRRTNYVRAGCVKAAVVLIWALAAAGRCRACSCVGPNPVCSVYWNTSLLFRGHVSHIDHIFQTDGKIVQPGEYQVHFEVTKFYRGGPQQRLVIHTPDQGSACGYSFQEGREYLVYGFASSDGQFSSNHCSRTHELTSGVEDADIQWLEGLATAPQGASVFGTIGKLAANEEGGYSVSPIPEIAVSVNGPQTKTVSTDAEGNFHVDGLAPGKYQVSAQAPNLYSPFGTSSVTLQNHSCAEVDWSTKLDGHLRGRVYFFDGTPAAGLNLAARLADADPHQPWTWQGGNVSTSPDGGFDFAQLAPGQYVIAVNMDFTSQNGPYYRKAFFPGIAKRSEAAVMAVGGGEKVDNLRFILPADSAAPSVPVQLTVLGFDGKPVSRAEILAYDDMWENSVTPLTGETDAAGKATLVLRPSSRYDHRSLCESARLLTGLRRAGACGTGNRQNRHNANAGSSRWQLHAVQEERHGQITDSLSLLVGSQSYHRVDARSFPRRQIAGQ